MVTIGKRMLPSLEGTLKSTGKALLDMVKEAAAPPPASALRRNCCAA